MRLSRILKGIAVSLACWSIVVPQSHYALAGPFDSNDAPSSPAKDAQTAAETPDIIDVAMTAGGTLEGKVIDGQGLPVDGAVVSLRQGDREVATVVTDENGTYEISGLRGGVYQMRAGEGIQVFRLWAPNTAPPKARSLAMVISESTVARGQFGPGMGLTGLIVLGASVSAAVISGINLNEIDELQDQVDRIPRSR